MDLDATQAIDFSDYDDETDEEPADVGKVPVAHLKVLCQKGFPETLFPVYEGDNLIGRQEGKCNIYLPLKALSREHARIEVRSGQHFIVDNSSRNKTRRGKLFLEAKAKYELRGGDNLMFGDVQCVYLTAPEMQSPQAAQPENDHESGSETGSESLLLAPDLLQNTVVYESEDEVSEPSVDLLMATQAYDADGNGPIRNQTGSVAVGLTFAADSDVEDGYDKNRPATLEKDSLVEETPAVQRHGAADITTAVGEPMQKLVFYKEVGDDDDATDDDVTDEDTVDADAMRRMACEMTQAFVSAEGGDDEFVPDSQAADNQKTIDVSTACVTDTEPTQPFGEPQAAGESPECPRGTNDATECSDGSAAAVSLAVVNELSGSTLACDSTQPTGGAGDDMSIDKTVIRSSGDCRTSTGSLPEALLNVSVLSSPGLQSTRVSEADFPTLMLAATPERSNDDMELVRNDSAMVDTVLVDNDGFAIPSQPFRSSHGGLGLVANSANAAAAAAKSEVATNCLNSDEVCTQAYPEPATELPTNPNSDEVCTQAYESNEMQSNVCPVANSDDMCTQAYTESNALCKSKNVPAIVVNTCPAANSDDVCTQAYAESNALCKSNNVPAVVVNNYLVANSDDVCTQAYTESNASCKSNNVPAVVKNCPAANSDDVCTQAYIESENIDAPVINTDDICTQAYTEVGINIASTSKLNGDHVVARLTAVNTDDVCTQAFTDAATDNSETQSLSERVESSQPLEDEDETGGLRTLPSDAPTVGEPAKHTGSTGKRVSEAPRIAVETKRRRRATAIVKESDRGSSLSGMATAVTEGGRKASRRSLPAVDMVENEKSQVTQRIKRNTVTNSKAARTIDDESTKTDGVTIPEKLVKKEETLRKGGRRSVIPVTEDGAQMVSSGRKRSESAKIVIDKKARKSVGTTESTEDEIGEGGGRKGASRKSTRRSVTPVALEEYETTTVSKRKELSRIGKKHDGATADVTEKSSSTESSENVEGETVRKGQEKTKNTARAKSYSNAMQGSNTVSNVTTMDGKRASRRKTATVTFDAQVEVQSEPTVGTRRRGRQKGQTEEVSVAMGDGTVAPSIVVTAVAEPETGMEDVKLAPPVTKRGRRSTRTCTADGDAKKMVASRRSKQSNTDELPFDDGKQTSSLAVEMGEAPIARRGRVKKSQEVVVSTVSPQSSPGASPIKTEVAVPTSRKRRATAVTSRGGPDAVVLSASEETTAKARRRKTVESRPKVMFTGMVDSHGEKIVVSLNGQVVSCVHECTHLVTDKVRRTVKFLCSIARGVPIVSPKWLEDSQKAHQLLDVSSYLVADRENEKKFGFRLKDSLDRANAEQMLSGYKIHVTPRVKPEPDQMADILQCAGAEYLSSAPRTYAEKTVVVSCDEDRRHCEDVLAANIPVVNSEFILTGVLKQQADVDSYRLFTEEENRPSKQAPRTKARSKGRSKK